MRDVLSVKGYITGPRWADIQGDLRRAALVADVDIRTERTTRFMTQTVTYSMHGAERNVNLLRQAIQNVLEPK